MNPYHHAPHFHYFRRGPSRLIWFVLGGVAASWWIKHKEMRTHERYMGYCHRKPVYPAPPASTLDENTANQSVNTSARPGATMPVVWGNKEWEEEKDRMWAMGRQAGDTMSELSEAALDNILSAVETLKSKLTEHRAERDRQRQPHFQYQPQHAQEEQKKVPVDHI